MRNSLLALAVALVCVGCSSPSTPVAAAELTEEQKTLYALGSALGRNLASFNLTEAEMEQVKAGVTDAALNKKLKVEDPQSYFPKIQELQTQRVAAAMEVDKKAGQDYIAKAATEKGAKKTESGMVFIPITEGTGASPTASDPVKVHYHGTLLNGEVFDSSVDRKEPVTFPLDQVIPCWTEGVQMMKVGGKAKLVCPSDLAYGDQGRQPTIKPGSTLLFEVELLAIEKPAAAQ